jgi:vesicle coat complex subunit
MSVYNQRRTSFNQVIDALLDENNPFPPVYLHRFSDIEPKDLKEVERVWEQIGVGRRRSLLEDLEELAEVDTLLSFHDFSKFTLKDKDPQVRVLAIRLLWQDEDAHLAPIFVEMMETDNDVQVRATAANALGFFIYQGEVEEIPEILLHDIEDSLLRVYNSEEQPTVRRRALESLGYSSRPEVPGLLDAAYQHENVDWLSSALFAMGRSADRRWQSQILDMIDHPASQVRLEAIRAAGELVLIKARESLLEIVQDDEDDDVRAAAIWSLSQIGGSDVRPILEDLLEETEDDEEAELIEDALDNLTFTEDLKIFDILDVWSNDEASDGAQEEEDEE